MAISTALVTSPIDATWITGNDTRNFIKDDPILDWLIQYGEEQDEKTGEWKQRSKHFHGFHPDNHPDYGPYIFETDFLKFILAKGKEFEKEILRLITQKLESESIGKVITVASATADAYDPRFRDQTLQLMKEGVAVIHQPILWDEERKLLGTPDLIVRSDVLNRIIPNSIDPERARLQAPILGGNWHYFAVDLKYSNITLDFQNEIGNDKAGAKAKLAVHNAALGATQGLTPATAYVIARGWIKGKNRGDSAFEKIGQFSIDQPQHAKGAPPIDWLTEALKARDWILRVRTEGHQWIGNYKDLPELRPNLTNDKDTPYRKAKKKIANASGELTGLWQIGYNSREKFIEKNNIDDWRSPVCCAKEFEIADSYKPWLDRILQVNRQENGPLVLPERVEADRKVWGDPAPVEFFVDFETVSDLNDDFTKLPQKNGNPLIFMIGCGHIENGEWKFECFIADELTPEGELKAITDWANHMNAVQSRIDPNALSAVALAKEETLNAPPLDPTALSAVALAKEETLNAPPLDPKAESREPEALPLIFHWSPAEKSTLITQYQSAQTRHGDKLPEVNFYDFLANVIKPKGQEDCVVVKGAFAFGLKAIGKALHNNGLIQTNWTDGPTDGLGAMTGAWWCYAEAKRLKKPILEITTSTGRELFREIRDYNEVDCKVMYETIAYLRSNH